MNKVHYPILLPFIAMSVRAQAPTESPIAQNIVWAHNSEGSDQLLKDGNVVRILVHNGIAVTAEVIRTDELMWVNVTLINRSSNRIDVDPVSFSLEETRPKQRDLKYQDPRDLAKSINRRAEWGAFFTVMAGDLSRKETITEANSVESATTTGTSRVNGTARNVYSGNEVQISGRSSDRYTTTANSHTTIRTREPDELARQDARMRAEAITAVAGMKAQAVLRQALLANTVRADEDIGGAVFFERDKKAREVKLRIPIGSSVFEIPLEIR